MVLNVIKTRFKCMVWDKSGNNLIIDQTMAGVKVAWVLSRPLYGTGEPVVLLPRCRSNGRSP